jgi:AsmA protein
MAPHGSHYEAGMSKSARRVLIAFAGIAVLILLLCAWLGPRLLGANVRSRLELGASDALGMDVHIGGTVGLRLFPVLHVTLTDLRITNHGAPVANAAQAELGIELGALLHKDLQVQSVAFKHVTIVITRDRNGHFNVQRPPKTEAAARAAEILAVSLTDANFNYTDALTGSDFGAQDCKLRLSDLRVAVTQAPELLSGVSFDGHLACGQMRTENVTASEVKAAIHSENGIVSFDPVTLAVFGGHGAGKVDADFSGALPVYRVHSVVSHFRIADFSKNVAAAKGAEGTMNFSADLTLRGTALTGVMQTVTGAASLHGENLVLEIGDLDKEFSRYESTQNFNLVDVGAFFLAGPLGLAITKGYDFARILKKSEGQTTIVTLVSEWKVEQGIALAQDVAMATAKNRVAMKGGLNFVNDSFDDVTVAMVDPKGCSRVEQKIRGPFGKPDVEKPNVLVAIAGPARKLFNKSRSLLGAKCQVFYSGTVAPPK